MAIICRNTTEAINHLAYRLRLQPDDVVVTTVVEHHANLLPWARVARRRYVKCDTDGTIFSDARDRGVPVLVDAAQLAPHAPLPAAADFIVWSGHKMYAPFGTGVLIGPRTAFTDGDPFLAGGGAVELVDLDDVVWSDRPDREEAGSPNLVGAIALHAAIDELDRISWPAIRTHDHELASHLHRGLAAIAGVRVLGPARGVTLPTATFVVDATPHALVAARLSAEHGIGVRHGCFCAHPYLLRLLALTRDEVADYRDAVRHGDRRHIPGVVRASTGLSTTTADIDTLIHAVSAITSGTPAPFAYDQDPRTGDFWPHTTEQPWADAARRLGSSCARG